MMFPDLMRKNAIAANNPSSATEDLLAKARDLYQAGRDDEALPELHRVVMLEPTNAEAYLLSGRINQRRGDQEAAIAALKTAIFWDPKLIDAHILLGGFSWTRRSRRSDEVCDQRDDHRSITRKRLPCSGR